MNILIISQVFPYPPHSSGAKLKLYYLMKSLAERNKIYLVSFYEADSELEGIGEVGKYCEATYPFRRSDRRDDSAFPLIRKIFGRFPAESHSYLDEAMIRKIGEVIREHKIDMVHCELIYMAQYAEYIPEKVPKIISINDVNWLLWKDMYEREKRPAEKIRNFVHYLRTRNFELKYYKKFDKCIVVSQRDRKELLPYMPDQDIAVIPNGVDRDLFVPSENRQDPPGLVFTGVMSYRPNIDAMQYFCKDIFPIIKREAPGVKLYIVGMDPAPEVESMGSDDIVVTGFVKDITEYATKASVYVAPLRMGSGIKNKVLEAMAMGLPIVASRSGIDAIDGTAGEDFLVADDPAGFAGAVVALLKDKGKRAELGKNARRTIENKYGWQQIAHKYEEMYKAVGKGMMAGEGA
ncbi:MAG: glycosyltransferase family 4 protein [Syntrophorhabdaceae bacterium]|nr:glycosyltransferase family 4 protein [Syntrophorhabdaceae bacterium]